MGKERLEEIEKRTFSDLPFKIKQDDLQFVFQFAKEQAERVQELEEYMAMYHDYALCKFRQNKRYREALEFYADEDTHKEVRHEPAYMGGVPIEPPYHEPPIIYYDKGQIARKALEGEE